MKIDLKLVLATGLALAVATTLRNHHSTPKPSIKAPYVRQFSYKINHAAIHKAKLFTVLISAEGFGHIERGTGVILDKRHVLTCAHVAMNDNDETWVYFYPGYLVARGKMVYADKAKDLAILELDVPVSGAPTPVFQEKHFDGEPITIIGDILGSMKWFVGYGIVSGENKRDLYTDGLVRGGDSGGPWINDTGEIVAITDWGLQTSKDQPEGISGGISAKTVNEFLRDWKSPNPLLQLFQMLGSN